MNITSFLDETFPIPTDTRGLWQGRELNETVHKRLIGERARAVELATAWRLAAEADGWVFEQTYWHAPLEQSFKSLRDGFAIRGLARPSKENSLGSSEISMWGPDGLRVVVPLVYPGMPFFVAACRHCLYCGATDVETVGYSFAGRCCEGCSLEMQRIYEYEGWNE